MLAQQQVETFLVSEVSKIMGVDESDLDLSASLLDSGADSLLLVELLQSINDQFGVSIAVGKVFSELTSIDQMALFIESKLITNNPEPNDSQDEPILEKALPTISEEVQSLASEAFDNNRSKSPLEKIVQQQLQIMTRHLELLISNKAIDNTSEEITKSSNLEKKILDQSGDTFGSNLRNELAIDDVKAPAKKNVDRFNLFDKRNEEDKRLEDEIKNSHISKLIDIYTLRTKTSKIETQSARRVLADNRASAGFRMSLKEMVYPILSDRTKGSHIWDIDGNEYIDFTMGFGTHLFGHSPDFSQEAMEEQFKIGMPIGPQSPLAGQVASLFCKLTKQDRVVFCNTGSEATMTAVRLARAASGRDKIAIFSGSYHGTFDGFLARRKGQTNKSSPVATGVIKSMVDNVVVLDYGKKSALDYIKKHGDELAAVIIEPVQSRHLSNQPKEFLTQVRALTLDSQTAFIWDEVITGFRIAPGGAQEYFGIQADIATYGKILGGGMPIGAVGGKAKYLDYIDGGWWQYGDESYPQSDMTFFAGTFSKHPLTMAASLSVLKHIEKQGVELQKQLGNITASMAQQLNRFFSQESFDIRIEYFGSLFRFESSGNLDLLFLHLMAKGIFIWEGRNCFISTAHSDKDIEEFITIVKSSVLALKKDHLAPLLVPQNTQQEKYLSASQRRFFDLSKKGSEGNKACNICVGLQLKGTLDKTALENSISRLVKRHESLHTNILGTKQSVCWDNSAINYQFINSSELEGSTRIEDWLAMDQNQEFQLEVGPLYRFKLYELDSDFHVLSIAAHHLICDGMAMVILIDELRRLYDAELQGVSAGLPPAEAYSQWVKQEATYIESEEYKVSRSHWETQLNEVIYNKSQSEFSSGSLEANRMKCVIEENVVKDLDNAKLKYGVSLFNLLLAAFFKALSGNAEAGKWAVGVPMAARNFSNTTQTVGNCVNIMPIIVDMSESSDNKQFIQTVKSDLHKAYSHMDVPYVHLQSMQDNQLFHVTFNMEPVQELPSLGNASVELVMARNAYSEFPIMINLMNLGDRIIVEVDYQITSYDEEQIKQLMDDFTSMIKHISEPDALNLKSDEGESLCQS